MYFIGIDLGTSSVKTLLMQEDGSVLRTVSRSYPVSYPREGWSEQNPEDWYERSLEAVCELIVGIDASEIGGIGCAGQMHGLVVLDAEDRVIRPAILWNDGRTEREVHFLNCEIGTDKIAELTGNIAFAGFTAPKILWMREHEPENFRRIRKVMLPKDYLVYRLTGAFVSDVSDASGTLLYDVRNRCWSEEMLSICSIREEQLPVVCESCKVVGVIKREIRELLGLNEVSVIAGAGDNAGAAVGTGAVREGQCMISLGTSGTIFIPLDSFRTDDSHAIHSFCDTNGKYHLLACMLAAASCGKWWIEDILGSEDYGKEMEGFSSDGSNSVYFLPYLMGERSPHNNANARGVFFGMSMSTTRAQLTQAVYEGVCFGLKDSMVIAEKLGTKFSSVRLCGGGAKSEILCQMVADIMGLPVELTQVEEGPGFGAAIMAAIGAGIYRDACEAAEKLIHIRRIYLPEPARMETYRRRYELFCTLYPKNKELFETFV